MKCRLCKLLCDRFCPPGFSSDFWRESALWERDHSNDWDLWVADSETSREQNERAGKINLIDPALAFQIRKSLADNGSVWAMERTGRHFENGDGVERDLAQAEKYYYRALLSGSWMATLELARLLFNHRINEKWEPILENGVESDFIPARFWLAWYRFERSARRSTAADVRPLIESAAMAGHPGARLILARWKIQAKFGLREVPQGFKEFHSVMKDFHTGQLRDYTRQAA